MRSRMPNFPFLCRWGKKNKPKPGLTTNTSRLEIIVNKANYYRNRLGNVSTYPSLAAHHKLSAGTPCSLLLSLLFQVVSAPAVKQPRLKTDLIFGP